MSAIEDAVIIKIAKRSITGVEKYGTTMERKDLSRKEWLIHAQEEAMDLGVYLERLIQEENIYLQTLEEIRRIAEYEDAERVVRECIIKLCNKHLEEEE